MEQRAREMGKSSEAAVYRKYINSMKKKTKKMNEEAVSSTTKVFWNSSCIQKGRMTNHSRDWMKKISEAQRMKKKRW